MRSFFVGPAVFSVLRREMRYATRLPVASLLRVRADIIGHARINMYVNISHAWFKMVDYIRTHRIKRGGEWGGFFTSS